MGTRGRGNRTEGTWDTAEEVGSTVATMHHHRVHSMMVGGMGDAWTGHAMRTADTMDMEVELSTVGVTEGTGQRWEDRGQGMDMVGTQGVG